METFDFTVLVTPEGHERPYTVQFRQQFYTEQAQVKNLSAGKNQIMGSAAAEPIPHPAM